MTWKPIAVERIVKLEPYKLILTLVTYYAQPYQSLESLFSASAKHGKYWLLAFSLCTNQKLSC